MMEEHDYFKSILQYVKKKSYDFLEKNELASSFTHIEEDAKANMNDATDYLNRLLNSTVEAVANKTGKEFSEVRDEFNRHYLSD